MLDDPARPLGQDDVARNAIVATERRGLRRLLSPLRRAISLTRAMTMLLTAQVSTRRAGVVLLYHRIGAVSGNPEEELIPAVSEREFRRQLGFLRLFLQPVTAENLQAAARSRRRFARFPFAITFDDDVEEHVTVAAPALREHGVPATFFMCGSSLQGPSPFWWERLQVAWDRGLLAGGWLPGDVGPVADDTVLGVAHRISRAAPWVHREVSARLGDMLEGAPMPAGVPAARMNELAEHFTVGFHTREHDCLQALSDEELDRVMLDGREELESVVGRPTRAFAYPHGAAAAREFDAARRAGYAVAFTTIAEAVTADDDPLALGRIEPGVVPLSVFAWHVGGALRLVAP